MARGLQDIRICMDDVNLSPEELGERVGFAYDSTFDPQPWSSLPDRLTALFPAIVANVYAYDETGILPEDTHSRGCN